MAWLQYWGSNLRCPEITGILIPRVIKRVNTCFYWSISLFCDFLSFEIKCGRNWSISCISGSLNIFGNHYSLLFSLKLKLSQPKFFRTITLSRTPMIWFNYIFKLLLYVIFIFWSFADTMLWLCKSERAQAIFQIVNIFLSCCHQKLLYCFLFSRSLLFLFIILRMLFLFIVFDLLKWIWIILIFSLYLCRYWRRYTIRMLWVTWNYCRGNIGLRLGLITMIIITPSFSLGSSCDFDWTHSIFLSSQVKLIIQII